MKLKNLILPAAVCFMLSGCVVAAVADLAATTVVTAGKLAVKGTGALINAAIPDSDDKDDKKKSSASSQQNNPSVNVPTQTNPTVYQQPYQASTNVPTQSDNANGYIRVEPQTSAYSE